MPNSEELMRQMNEAADQAKTELQKHYTQWSAREVADWWNRWYLKAGHKRLGRILIAMTKLDREQQNTK